jgi:hypothetical protein
MTGADAWSLVAPMILMPQPYSSDSPQCQDMIEAYVLVHIGTQLYDNWVANGKPDEWRNKPGKEKRK